MEFVIVMMRIALLAGDGASTAKKIENFMTEKLNILPIPGQFTMPP